jgi:hypothetical protein
MKKKRLTPSTMPSVARASRTRVAAATATGTKAVAATTTRVPIASASQTTLSLLSNTLRKTSFGGFKDLLKEKCPWHLDGNHTTEQCYQLR